MKTLFFFFLVSVNVVMAQESWPDRTRVLPHKLRGIPVGLTLWHSPAFVVPQKIDSLYFWKHTTSIKSEIADLEFVEAGSFIWYDDRGWQANMLLNRKDLAEDFKCKDGRFPKGKTFIFEKNWRYGKNPYGGDALWYVLAKDHQGKIYKGYALVETEDLNK